MTRSLFFSVATTLLLASRGVEVNAHGHGHAARHHVARQAAALAASSSHAATSTVAVTSASAAAGAATTAAAAAPGAATGLPSLASTNPTAAPIASINPSAATLATVPLNVSPSAGATPSAVSGAPGLPNISGLDPTKYPPMDKIPDINSPQVKAWIQEVANSGLKVPNITATVDGGCPSNLDAVNNDGPRCWWTCSGCTRDTDITTCPDKNTWGLTYDDGPSFYTPNLLAYLAEQNLKATFFTVGSRCLEFPSILQSEYLQGHQIAVHTWSHPSLTTLSNEEIIAELGWAREIIRDVLGVTPNMMRPPFGDIDDRVRNISVAMGMTPVMWTRLSPTQTFDTDDFDLHSTATPQEVLTNWENILSNATSINTGFIVLEHDLWQQSVEIATGYILPDAQAKGLTIKPVVDCLNKPMSDAYVETNNNSTNPPAASGGGANTLSAGGAASTHSGTSGQGSGALASAPVGLALPIVVTLGALAAAALVL